MSLPQEDPRLFNHVAIPKTFLEGDDKSLINKIIFETLTRLDQLEFQVILNTLVETFKNKSIIAVNLRIENDSEGASALLGARYLREDKTWVDVEAYGVIHTDDDSEAAILEELMSMVEEKCQDISNLMGPKPFVVLKKLINTHLTDKWLTLKNIESIRENTAGDALKLRRSLEEKHQLDHTLKKKEKTSTVKHRI